MIFRTPSTIRLCYERARQAKFECSARGVAFCRISNIFRASPITVSELWGGSTVRFLISIALVAATFSTSVARAEDDIAAAREHFDRGTKAYDLAHYAEAVKEYEEAYRAKADPALLFNVGQAFRGAGDAENAIKAFKSFLRRVPDSPNRAEVEARIAELQRAVEIQKKSNVRPTQGTLPPGPLQIVLQQVATTRPANADELQTAKTKRIAGLAVGAVGVVALGLGGAFTGLAANANGRIVEGTTWNPSMQDRRNGYEVAYVTCFAAGGAAIVSGLVLYLIGKRDAYRSYPVDHVQFTPTVSSRAGSVSLSGRF